MRDYEFRRHFRITRHVFDEIVEALRPHLDKYISKRSSHAQRSRRVSAEEKVAIYIQHLAKYPGFLELGLQFDVSQEYARRICQTVAKLFLAHFGDQVRLPTQIEALQAAAVFKQRFGMSNCCGAADGSHIPFKFVLAVLFCSISSVVE